MSAEKKIEQEILEENYFLNKLRLLIPKEIERYTKRKLKERVSAFKAVSGDDIHLEYATYVKEIKDHVYDGHDFTAQEPSFDQEENQAKILPFGKNETDSIQKREKQREDKEKAILLEKKQNIQNKIQLLQEQEQAQINQRGIVSSELLREKKVLEKALLKLDDISATEFLLKQRKDLEGSNQRLKGQLAHQTYLKIYMSDIGVKSSDQDEKDGEEKVDISGKGILLNKRQY